MRLRNLFASVVILALAACGAFAQTKIKDVPVTYTPPTAGHEMFTAYCAACHGTSGKGDGPAAPALKKAPADLTQLTVKNGGKFPELRISQYIFGDAVIAAHGSREMPVWGALFNSMDKDSAVRTLRIRNLSDYIQTLQAK